MKGTNELIEERVQEISIDDFLKGLIADSDLVEVVCCLDQIAKESGKRVELYENGVREYPA